MAMGNHLSGNFCILSFMAMYQWKQYSYYLLTAYHNQCHRRNSSVNGSSTA